MLEISLKHISKLIKSNKSNLSNILILLELKLSYEIFGVFKNIY
jgi:hypothetical protein